MLGVAVSLLYGMPLPISEHFSNITTPIGVLDPTNAASVYTAVGPPPIMAMFFTLCAPELLKGERRSAELVARAHQRNRHKGNISGSAYVRVIEHTYIRASNSSGDEFYGAWGTGATLRLGATTQNPP